MRIAVLDKKRCKPADCNYLCIRFCPINKTGGEAIVKDEEDEKPVISESLCTGCGICVKKCPYDAIKIINLPQEVGDPVHQYGLNGFRLYNLPLPRAGVVGLVGANGVGKTTALKILLGEVKPNLGGEAGWEDIIERFRGHELMEYLAQVRDKKIRAVYKPQYVESIPRYVSGTVSEVLSKTDERGALNDLTNALDIGNILERDVSVLSGGELQRVAICACLLRDADVYLLDEPSSYLDVRERLNVAKTLRSMGDKRILVVEHDLVVLDYLSDYVHVFFGKQTAYGIVSNILGVRQGVNEYLGGFLRSENMRFRDEIRFDVKPPKDASESKTALRYPDLSVDLGGFNLSIKEGSIKESEVLGVLGPNATGKTSFVKVLAGVQEADKKIDLNLEVSYKPQYIKPRQEPVASLHIAGEFLKQFDLTPLLDKPQNQLSGGELQRVAIADCLTQSADLYMLDEPSAYLDVEQRLALAKYLKKYAYDNKKSVLVVDHDILLVDYLSDRLMIFSGEAGMEGVGNPPTDLVSGMNFFLKQMQVTFRRDPDTGRPRANKSDSVKDRQQKQQNKYYYQ
ncbi:MAG: ribosome biogenesis/translation initiation ATPase RLI [Candidatus Altiarchaeales archaeon]|nr:ribosome biogenesis/translation initiation ATPase RLI [Candidatus Altiarchaeales archaeon]